MSDVWMLRTGILIAGLLLIAAIYFFGRPRRPGQGRRIDGGREAPRTEPTLGEEIQAGFDAAGPEEGEQAEIDLEAPGAGSELGRRTREDFDKIVSLYVAAKAGSSQTRLLVLLMLVVCGLGSIMSSTAVTAIFIPVALRIAHSTGTAPGRLMMPLSAGNMSATGRAGSIIGSIMRAFICGSRSGY